MLRKRVEKLEARMPVLPGKLMESLDERALSSLCRSNRDLVNDVYGTARGGKTWTPEHHAAVERLQEAYGLLLQDVSDQELEEMVAQVERKYGKKIHDQGAVV